MSCCGLPGCEAPECAEKGEKRAPEASPDRRIARSGATGGGPRHWRRYPPNPAAPLCGADPDDECGFRAALAEQMWQSLLGNPHTIFVEDPSRANAPGGFFYARVRSQNADWFQQFDGDRSKLRDAIDRQRTGKPLNLRRKEDRWLAEQTELARKRGWYATFDGKDSPIGIDPEPPLKRASLKGARRVYLALPEEEVRRMKMRAYALHMSPNLWLNNIVADRLEREDALDELDKEDEVPF